MTHGVNKSVSSGVTVDNLAHVTGILFKMPKIQAVSLVTEPSISLIMLPLMRILQRNLKRTTDTH